MDIKICFNIVIQEILTVANICFSFLDFVKIILAQVNRK